MHMRDMARKPHLLLRSGRRCLALAGALHGTRAGRAAERGA